nr:M48 family metallopeptidase [Shewanella abyssi]
MGFEASELAPERQAQLQQMFSATVEKLDPHTAAFSQTPKLMLRHTGEMANAFALADGHVILTDAMVNLAANDAQLEAVVLHELGHIQQRHILTNLVQSAILSISAALIVGETSGISDILVSFTVLGTSLSYSRQHEREADEFAATYLQRWYQSTASLVQLYQALDDGHDVDIPGWASTHPELTERIETLQLHDTSQQ